MTIRTKTPHPGCPALSDLSIAWPDGSFTTAIGVSEAQLRFLALCPADEAKALLTSDVASDIAWPKGA